MILPFSAVITIPVLTLVEVGLSVKLDEFELRQKSHLIFFRLGNRLKGGGKVLSASK